MEEFMFEKRKKCSKCGKAKKLSEFATQTGRKYDKHSQCKSCRVEYKKEYMKEYMGDESNRQRVYELQSIYKNTIDKDKVKIRKALNRAIESGYYKRASEKKCKDCGNQAQEHHHLDYENPYNVVPLCKKCHRKRHT